MSKDNLKFLLPLGFKAAAVGCNIKKAAKFDLGLIYSIIPARTVALFTQNRLKSAHIKLDSLKLKNNLAQAIIVNSGNANCANGAQGLNGAAKVTKELAKVLDIEETNALIASTGVIGRRFPEEKIRACIMHLVKNLNYSVHPFAQAIMTTDTFLKTASVDLNIGKEKIKIIGTAKGAGMIYPQMGHAVNHATMLCFLMTDANINIAALKSALKIATDESFNSISVDADTSPNDSIFLMANGLAGNKEIRPNTAYFTGFKQAVVRVCRDLAKMVVEDGEGATKFVQIIVTGAKTEYQAKLIAASISRSLLVKTMFFGADPNWGRVLSAAGASGANFNPEKCDIFINKKPVFCQGRVMGNINSVQKTMQDKRAQEVILDLNMGKCEAFVWTTDLSLDYVKINASYTT